MTRSPFEAVQNTNEKKGNVGAMNTIEVVQNTNYGRR